MASAASSEKPKEAGFLLTALAGFLLINGAIGLHVLCSRHFSWMLGNLSAVAVMVAGFVLGVRLQRLVLWMAAIIALAAAVICGLEYHEYFMGGQGRIVHIASPDELEKIEGPVSGFYFSSARVAAQFRGEYDSPSDSESRGHSYYAAPVVSDGWDTNEQVSFWAACGESQECLRSWEKPYAAGAVIQTAAEVYGEAIKDAQERYRLKPAARIFLLEWTPSPEEAIAVHYEEFRSAFEIWNIVWLVFFALWETVSVISKVVASRGGVR